MNESKKTFWVKLPKRFGKYVRSGQFKRARWLLSYREKRKQRSQEYWRLQQMQLQQNSQNNQLGVLGSSYAPNILSNLLGKLI